MAGKTRGAGARRRRTVRRATQRVARTQTLVAAAADPTQGDLDALYEFGELAVSGKSGLPLGARTQSWDAAAADKAVRAWADATDGPNAKYAQAFFYKGGDGSSFGDFKLGFAEPVDGALTANWGGIVAVAGALQGARGGVKGISPADTAGIKGKVAGYYSAAAKKYGDDSIKPPWTASTDAEAAALLALAEFGSEQPELVAVATAVWEERFAAPPASEPACSNCDHAYASHGSDGGACSMANCDCAEYESPKEDKGEPGEEATVDPVGFIRTATVTVNTDGMRDEILTAVANRVTEILTTDDFMAGIPAEHAATFRMRLESFKTSIPVPKPSVDVTPPATGSETQWSAIMCPEGQLTSDGRAFAPGSIKWRELPLTLMAMTETDEGHKGAQVAGRIDDIWRDDKAGLIRAKGVFDGGEYGQEIARMVDDQTLRGVSVDLAIHGYDTGPKSDWFDEDGNWAPKPEGERAQPSPIEMLLGTDDPTVAVVNDAEIGMTTVCPFPAFAVAKIAMGDSLVAGANPAFWTSAVQGGFVLARAVESPLTASGGPVDAVVGTDCGCAGDALTASADGLAPVEPPRSWFDVPDLDGPTPLTITDDGRVYGHAATWETCHIGIPQKCVTPPHSSTDYAYFLLGEVLCDDGERVAVGSVTIDAPHAGLQLDGKAAQGHYDHTGCVVAHITVGEDEHGIWVAGAIAPDASAEKVRSLRGAKLSGDWRYFDDAGGRELVGLLAVNVPGFPVPRPRAAVVASADGEEVMALIAAGIPGDVTPDDVERIRAVAAQAEFARLVG